MEESHWSLNYSQRSLVYSYNGGITLESRYTWSCKYNRFVLLRSFQKLELKSGVKVLVSSSFTLLCKQSQSCSSTLWNVDQSAINTVTSLKIIPLLGKLLLQDLYMLSTIHHAITLKVSRNQSSNCNWSTSRALLLLTHTYACTYALGHFGV